MKKMKALLLSLVLGLSVATAVTAVGCKDNVESSSGNNQSASSNWFPEDTGSSVSVRFSESEMNVYQYESVALSCTAKGAKEAVVYTSSDESIATVDANGVVWAKDKVGSVTVTATVEGVSASCKVNVQESPYAPAIVLGAKSYTMEKGETLKFTVSTEWNKTELTEDLEYAVSFAEDSQDVAAEISVDGNEITVTSENVESFNIIVSTTARGIYTSELISVNVVAPKLKLQPANSLFQPQTGGYKASLSATDLVGNMANSLPLEFVAVKGSETLEEVAIDWTVNGDGVVIEDGMVIGQSRGETTLTGTATYNGETATVTVTCNVIAPEVLLERTATLEVANIKDHGMTFEEGELIGKLQNAEFHGVQVSSRVTQGKNILFNGDMFPQEASKLGRQELIINTNLVRYVMNVDVYTMIINDADELDAFRTVANTGETEYSSKKKTEVNSEYYDGYFVLGNDIDYNRTITCMTDTGTVWGIQGTAVDHSRGFKGVFDGMGYNIDGVTVGKNRSGSAKEGGGIFGYISTNGIVKNVSFTNAVLLNNQGFLCSYGNGTIENVSVSYKKIGQSEAEIATSRQMGTFFAQASGPNATVRNCLIDASAAEIDMHNYVSSDKSYNNLQLAGTATNKENVIALCPDENVLVTSNADVQRKSYLDLIAEPGLTNSFDTTIWTKVDGIPMFVNQANTLDRNAAIDFLNVDPSIIVGIDMVIRANNPYVKFDIIENADGEKVEGVTLVDSMLSAQEIAFKKTVRLQATSLLNSEVTATFDVYVDSFGSGMAAPTTEEAPVINSANPVLTVGDNSWIGDADIVYVYLGKDVIGSGKDPIVVNDWIKCEWGVDNKLNKLTVVLVNKPGEAEETRTHFEMDFKLWYTPGDIAKSEIVTDSAFSTTTFDGKHTVTYVEAEADITAPAGFEKVNKAESAMAWESAMSWVFFNQEDLSGYSDIWFAIKFVGDSTKYVFQTESVTTSDWVQFHYTQTSEGVWVAEVTYGGKVQKYEFDILDSSQLAHMFYRGGWSNGFLLYNNGGDASNAGDERDSKIYVTEIRGIAKA